MIDDQVLNTVIDNSPLSREDKEHWKQLLPKLGKEQRKRLHHSLTTKTEVSQAINLIQKALKIIDDLENQAVEDAQQQQQYEKERDDIIKEITSIREKEEEIISNEDQLKRAEQDTQAQLEAMLQELKQLSQEVHGSPPPSMNQQSQG